MRELTQLRDLLASLSLDADRAGLPAEVRQELHDAAAARQALVDDIDAIFGATEPGDPPPTMPVVAAVLGPSGVGKSTLINRLVGDYLVPTGDLRPTTIAPVWVCSPTDQAALDTALDSDVTVLTAPELPPGLALVEHPDPGVTDQELPAPVADLYLVVVSPTRYGDPGVWELLESLCSRTGPARPSAARPPDVRIALVLTRFPQDEDDAVDAHRDTTPMIRDVTRRIEEHAVEQVMLVALPDREDALDSLRHNLWAYAGTGEVEPEDAVRQQRFEEALLRLVDSLEERLRPILGLRSTVNLGGSQQQDRVDQVVSAQQAVWAAEAWRACRANEQITGLLGALQLQAADGTGFPTALHRVAAEVWEELPTALALATRRHTRSMQRSLAALDESSRAPADQPEFVPVVTPGRATSHIRSLGTALQVWLTETMADLTLLEDGNPTPLPHSVAALGVVLSTIGTMAGGDRGLEGDGTAFLDQLVRGQIASQMQSEGDAQGPREVADDLRQVCSNRLGRLLRTAARCFLDQPAAVASDTSAVGQTIDIDVDGLLAAALDVTQAETPTVATDPSRP